MDINIPAPWGHIAVKRWGPAIGKPVITIHGWQDNAGTFDTLVPLLPHDWTVICIDLPGHGLSSHFSPGTMYYILDYMYAVRHVVSYLKWKRFNFIGHSLGSTIAIMYSSVFPNEIDHLVSLDITVPWLLSMSNTSLVSAIGTVLDQRMKFDGEGDNPRQYTYEEALQRILDNIKGLTRESAMVLMKRGAKFVSEDKVVFTRDRRLGIFLPIASQFCLEQFKNIILNLKCKFMILKAIKGLTGREEIFVEVRQLYEKTLGTNFEYYDVEGTHHFHLNTPEVVAPYIIKFIQ